MQIVHTNLGNIGEADVEVKDGALVASIKVPFIALLDGLAAKAKAAIPGQIDDAIFDLVLSALKAELAK